MAKSEWAKTTELIDAAVSILAQEFPMTVRQCFYRLVSAGLIENNRGCYQTVSRVLTIARNDGRCAWEYIVDRSRPEYTPNVFDDAAGYALAVKRSYRKNYWADQSFYVEVWSEKDARNGSGLSQWKKWSWRASSAAWRPGTNFQGHHILNVRLVQV